MVILSHTLKIVLLDLIDIFVINTRALKNNILYWTQLQKTNIISFYRYFVSFLTEKYSEKKFLIILGVYASWSI